MTATLQSIVRELSDLSFWLHHDARAPPTTRDVTELSGALPRPATADEASLWASYGIRLDGAQALARVRAAGAGKPSRIPGPGAPATGSRPAATTCAVVGSSAEQQHGKLRDASAWQRVQQLLIATEAEEETVERAQLLRQLYTQLSRELAQLRLDAAAVEPSAGPDEADTAAASAAAAAESFQAEYQALEADIASMEGILQRRQSDFAAAQQAVGAAEARAAAIEADALQAPQPLVFEDLVDEEHALMLQATELRRDLAFKEVEVAEARAVLASLTASPPHMLPMSARKALDACASGTMPGSASTGADAQGDQEEHALDCVEPEHLRAYEGIKNECSELKVQIAAREAVKQKILHSKQPELQPLQQQCQATQAVIDAAHKRSLALSSDTDALRAAVERLIERRIATDPSSTSALILAVLKQHGGALLRDQLHKEVLKRVADSDGDDHGAVGATFEQDLKQTVYDLVAHGVIKIDRAHVDNTVVCLV